MTHAMSRFYTEGLLHSIHAEYKKLYLVTFFNGPLLDTSTVTRIEQLGVTVTQFSATTRVRRVIALQRAYAYVRKILATEQSDVFLANPNEAITNWLCFPKTKEAHPNVRLMLTPEGISNFYLPIIRKHDRQSNGYRLACKALMIPFQENRGLVLGFGAVPYSKYWYVGNPGITGRFMKTRNFHVQRPEVAIPIQQRTWIFLGIPSLRGDALAEYQNILAKALLLSGGRLHYKPHPHEKISKKTQSMLHNAGAIITNSLLPAEYLALSYQTVAGILSSSLLNLRLLGWHEDVRCILELSTLSRLTGRPDVEIAELVDIFKSVGITNLEGGRIT